MGWIDAGTVWLKCIIVVHTRAYPEREGSGVRQDKTTPPLILRLVLLDRENMGGAAVLCQHSLLRSPSFPAVSRPKFGKPFLPLKELGGWSSTRADESRKSSHLRGLPKAEGLEDDPSSVDGMSSLPPNKEKILALFKRIQASISKGETKKRSSKLIDDGKTSADAIFEVLHQSRDRLKGKTSGRRVSKSPATRRVNVSPRKEETTEHSVILKSTRPPSSFLKRSPITTPSSPRHDRVELRNETSPVSPTPSVPREETQQKTETLPSTDDLNVESSKFKEMNLAQLKEVAKSRGIRGYSKLKKGELVGLLVRLDSNV